MPFLKEFKTFISNGNVVELAVGVIIGSAFGTIVSSLVDDIVTPLLLNPALKAANVQEIAQLSWSGIKYGNFLSAVIKFLIIAIVLIFIVKIMNAILKKEVENAPSVSPTEILLMEIRDALNKNQG
jgi:large conductance mechanosensitive channel